MYGLNQVLVACSFHFIDLLSGLIAAIKNKDVQSSKMRDGIFKKLGFIICYVLAYMVDTQQEVIGLRIGANILPVVVVYAVTTEIVSIIENIARINPELLPEKLTSFFHITTEEGEKDGKH